MVVMITTALTNPGALSLRQKFCNSIDKAPGIIKTEYQNRYTNKKAKTGVDFFTKRC